MPMAISPLAIVLLSYSRTHSYGISGAVTATYAFAAAFSGPRWARLADRKGQRFAITRGLPMHVVVALPYYQRALSLAQTGANGIDKAAERGFPSGFAHRHENRSD